MNRKDESKLTEFPKRLDEIVNKRFRGAKCVSRFSIVAMTHITTWNHKLPVKTKRRIKLFVEGFMSGNSALRDHMLTK